MSEKNIENITKSDSNFAPTFVDHHQLPDINFKENFKKITLNKTNHVFAGNELKKLQTFDSSLFICQSYFNNDGTKFYLLFQPIYKTITIFSGLKDTISEWESKGLSNETFTCAYIANVGILILSERSTQGLDDTTLTVEAKYSINFPRSNRKFCLSLHYNGSNSFLFVNDTKIYQFKANDSEIKNIPCV